MPLYTKHSLTMVSATLVDLEKLETHIARIFHRVAFVENLSKTTKNCTDCFRNHFMSEANLHRK